MAGIYIDDDDEQEKNQNKRKTNRYMKRYQNSRTKAKKTKKINAKKSALSSHVSPDEKKEKLKRRLDAESTKTRGKNNNIRDGRLNSNKNAQGNDVRNAVNSKSVDDLIQNMRAGRKPQEIEQEESRELNNPLGENQEQIDNGTIRARNVSGTASISNENTNANITPSNETVNLNNNFNNLNSLNGKKIEQDSTTPYNNRQGETTQTIHNEGVPQNSNGNYVQGEVLVPNVARGINPGGEIGEPSEDSSPSSLSGKQEDNTQNYDTVDNQVQGGQNSTASYNQRRGARERVSSITDNTNSSAYEDNSQRTPLPNSGATQNWVNNDANLYEQGEEEMGQSASDRARNAATAAMIGRGLNTGARKTAKGVRGAYRWVGKRFSFVKKIGIIASAAGILIWVLLIIGAVSFIINMPGMVLDKLKLEAMDFWDAITGYVNKTINGQDLPSDQDIKNLALYLNKEMGYDLEYMGFATVYKYDEKTKKTDEVKTKYLPLYLAAEERSYLVENQTESWSLSSLWNGLKDVLVSGFSGWDDVSFGTGVLHIEANAIDVLEIKGDSTGTDRATMENKVKVYRREKEMLISRNPTYTDYYASSGNDGIEGYRFKLKYWIEKYTTPLDFYIALHVATRAPEFVAELATNPSQGFGLYGENGKVLNTRIDINVATLQPGRDVTTELVYLDIDPNKKKINIDPETNLPVMLTIQQIRAKLAAGEKVFGFTGNKEMDDRILNQAAEFNASNLVAFTPYITKVVNHWYYREIIYQGTARSGTYTGDVDVYRTEDLETPTIRYQRYQAIQMPETAAVSTGDGTGAGTGTGTGTSSGEGNGGSSGEGSGGSGTGGSTEQQTATDTGNKSNVQEQSTGDDRKKMEESTQKVAEDTGLGLDGFWGSLMNIINSYGAWTGTLNGITGFVQDLPRNILSNSFNALGGLINSAMPDSLLGNITSSWLGRLSGYAYGMPLNLSNLKQYLDVGKISDELGITNLKNILTSDNLIKDLGLNTVKGTLANVGQVADLSGLPYIAASSLDMPGLTTAFSDVTGMMRDGAINTSSIVNTLYDGASEVLRGNEVAQHVLGYSMQAFSGVRNGTAAQVAAGLIGGLATDIVDRTTGEFFNTVQEGIEEQLKGQYDVQVERLLQNENSKNLTGLTIDELESVASVNNLDFNKVESLNNELVTIKESVDESTVASRQLSDTVNQIAMDYAGVDAVTFYYLVKSIEAADEALKEAGYSLDSIEDAIKDGMQISNQYQIDGLINGSGSTTGARQYMEKIKELLKTLDVDGAKETFTYTDDGGETSIELTPLRKNARELASLGAKIQYNIERNTTGIAKSILGSLATGAEKTLQTAGDAVERIDINTLNKYKRMHPDATLDDLKQLASELEAIEPALNGMTQDIIKMGDKLEDVNEGNANNVINSIDTYNANVDKITWMTPSEKTKLKSQANTVRSNVNYTRQQILSSSLGLMNDISNRATGITTYKINSLANQILNLPNNTVHSLLNTAREVPRELIREASDAFTKKVAEAIVTKTKEDLAERVSEGLKGSLDGNGELTSTVQAGNGTGGKNPKVVLDEEEQPVEGMENEFLTGFYIKETRTRDYMQKSEPILVPYRFERWKKTFITDKYLIAGTDTYDKLRKQYPGVNLFEDKEIVAKYGQSLWNAASSISSGSTLEEAIYAELSSSESVDSQYLLRYFKELFNTYGDSLRAAAAEENKKADNTKYTIGWIFETKEVDEIINTNTNATRRVLKSDYEPVSWPASNTGILYSKKNQPVYGFDKDIDIVSPNSAVIVNKTEKKKNELGEVVTGSITLQITSTDPNIDGMRVIIKGGDFSIATVGSTVMANSSIGKTTDDNLIILVLQKGSHAQVSNVSQYIYPPYVTINN